MEWTPVCDEPKHVHPQEEIQYKEDQVKTSKGHTNLQVIASSMSEIQEKDKRTPEQKITHISAF